jgi:regulatory protein
MLGKTACFRYIRSVKASIMDPEGIKPVLEKAMRYCSSRETCRADLLKKIQSWGLTGDPAIKVINQLEQEGFLNELRYARAAVNDQYRFNKWGRIKIRYYLQQHGIPASIITEALEGIDEEEYRRMIKNQLTEKEKHSRFVNQWDRKAKLLRFAASRGYETGIVSGIIGEEE